jgi:hypothetical protein
MPHRLFFKSTQGMASLAYHTIKEIKDSSDTEHSTDSVKACHVRATRAPLSVCPSQHWPVGPCPSTPSPHFGPSLTVGLKALHCWISRP